MTFSTLSLLVGVCLLIGPVSAFGAGDVPNDSNLDGHVWRHGDIANLLLKLPISFVTNYAFTKLELKQVYFGNWLRDYSQLIDTKLLSYLPEPVLRTIISVLAFKKFGFATNEFDVTHEALGVYRPEEHIDNPRDYAKTMPTGEIHSLDSRLRGRVSATELEIDPRSGMKNYIANESGSFDTSSRYVRRQLLACIREGRQAYQSKKESPTQALIYLGAALHTLEDFAAHSNYVELALRKLGVDAFPLVGDSCKVTVPGSGLQVPPLVTGTYGMVDILQSLLGEVDDKASHKEQGELDEITKNRPQPQELNSLFMALKQALGELSAASSTPGLKGDLQLAMDKAKDAQQDPSKYDPKKSNSKPNELWEAIVPMFRFHDQIAKFMLEHEAEFKVPFLSSAKKEIEDSIDKLTDKFLAFFIDPAVMVMRDGIKISKELAESQDRELQNYVDIWGPNSRESDPSHSVLSKDHYSNVLNPVAGRVSLALINYATQKVVRAWEDLSDPNSVVDSILAGFHHPYFMDASSDVQKQMYLAVTSWWQTRTEEKKRFLSSVLTKDGVHANQNNPVVSAAEFANDIGSGWSFLGPLPKTEQRPPKPIGSDTTKLIEQAGQLIKQTLNQIDQGVAQVGNTIGQGVDTAGHALNDFNNSVNNTATTVLRNNLGPSVPQIVQQASNINTQLENERRKLAENPTKWAGQAAEEGFKGLGNAWNSLPRPRW
ncbi:heterokaryon incompatibility Het-C [Stipitochalara longipes BDJ]|nr:heterokaryon incompatibility Het-C [Stipitochalara longipes BDJ]